MTRRITAAATEILSEALSFTDEWHELRKPGISSSEIAAIMGLSKWESPWGLWQVKAGILEPDRSMNNDMAWGTRLESAICDEFAERHPEFGVVPVGLAQNDARPLQLATVDRLLMDGPTWTAFEPVAILEVKTANDFDEWGEEGSDEIPPYYRAQVMWQLDTLQLPVAYVAVLVRGRQYREYTILHDETEARAMYAIALDFMESVRDGREPDFDAHSATAAALKRRYSDLDEDAEAEVPAEWVEQYRLAQQNEAAAKKAKTEAGNHILGLMGNAKTGVVAGQKVATRTKYMRKPYLVEASEVDYINVLKPKKEKP